jgi:hypothetical protein
MSECGRNGHPSPPAGCLLSGVKQTSRGSADTSGFDPERTSAGETTAAFWNRVVCERRTVSYPPSSQSKCDPVMGG